MQLGSKLLGFAAVGATAVALGAAPVFAAQVPPIMPPVAAAAIASSGTVLDAAAADGHFTTFLEAVKEAGLTDELSGATPVTVFAPTDAAFAKLPASAFADLMRPDNRPELRALLLSYVLPGSIPMHGDGGTLSSGSVASVEGRDLTFGSHNGSITVDGADVVLTDVKAANGYLDGVDSVTP